MGIAESNMDNLVEFSKLIEEHKQKLLSDQEGGSSKKDQEKMFDSFVGLSAPKEVDVHPPAQSKNKGSGKRMKSNKENSIAASQKKRRICKTCGERAGHNARTCPKKGDMCISTVHD
ncbi:Unknown protein [Striga hermonthica]|uniref:Uncharacterized protein n=1 Tax=Striga hermonthica TaxID=68872 RepID=A0A9N7MHH4_STRHE|nr:Unknown protein [Striga hermonthica]